MTREELAGAVGADLAVMARDAKRMRGDGPFVFARVTRGDGLEEIAALVLHAWYHAVGAAH